MGVLDGRVVVVTGGGRGIGRATALRCATEGARVVVNDTGVDRDGTGGSPGVAEAVAGAIRAAGGEAVAVAHSVTTAEGARAVIHTAVSTYGGVDAVINQAGILRDKSLLKMDDESFDAVVAVILRGTWQMCRAAAQCFVDQKRGGRIVNTTGAAGLYGNLGQANYSAACAGVYGLTRTLAIEMKKHRVCVNALAPVARTRMTEDLPMFGGGGLKDETFGPGFVAPAAVFLASDLSGDLTGEVLGVAGTRLSLYRVQESHGVVGDDPRSPWAPAAIRARWDELARY